MHYVTSEVADALAVSPNTLRRLAHSDASLGPVAVAMYGAVSIGLYDDASVVRVGAHLAARSHRRGRQRRWDDESRRRRRAAHTAAGYYRRRARDLAEQGRLEDARRAEESRNAILRELSMDVPSWGRVVLRGRIDS